jgi:hypothetical protein
MRNIKTSLVATLIGALLVADPAFAEVTAAQLMGAGMPGEQAVIIAGIGTGGTVQANALGLKFRNAGDTADITWATVDAADDTVLQSSASDDLVLKLEDDTQRTIKFDGSADTSLRMFWGDGGTTAAQNLMISGGTSAGDDDQQLCLTGGGDCGDSARGSFITLAGEEDADGGDVVITSVDDVIISGQASGDLITLAAVAGATDLTIASNVITVAAGTTLVGGAGSWGWTLVNATDNQACTTGCGISACMFGFDSGAATLAGILACSDATADLCFCTGAAS